MVKGYDLFGDHGRNLPTPHGSGARPMYGDMGKSCRPNPNRKREWSLSDDIEIKDVTFADGLLTITLGKIVPEHHAKKVYL